MLRTFKDRLRSTATSFRRDQSGAVAIIMALAAVPVIGLAGASLDYSRVSDVRTTYQDAADAAVLAAATSVGRSLTDRQDVARDVFRSMMPTHGHAVDQINLFEHELGYHVHASGTVDLTLMSVLGITEADIAVNSVAAAASAPLEISFVIDATRSMLSGSRWRTAYDSLDNMLQELDAAADDEGELFVTVGPMGDVVNIGNGRDGWVSGLEGSPGENLLTADEWNGCVMAREEPTGQSPYRLTDANPAEVPFLILDHRYEHGEHDQRWFSCGETIIGPSQDVAAVIRDVGQISAAGTGRFDQGLAWGWRTVSANWNGEWGIPGYPDNADERRKVVVFISDGNSTMEDYLFDGHSEWGWNNGGTEMFGNLVETCTQIKAQGIQLYMLFVEGNPHAESFMRECATSPAHFFDVTTNDAMVEAFGAMGSSLSEVRLVR
ncbi:MAG: hypothetical protein KI785_13095 [Devosiaceae bacterium]|nr:hypothetical protein [Devosiaceae bacterium MH13]